MNRASPFFAGRPAARASRVFLCPEACGILPMKTIAGILLMTLLGSAGVVRAAGNVSQSTQIVVPAPTPYVISVQDGNSRVWQQTVYQPTANGGIITNTQGYTELASGLNHWVNGQWVAASEHIDILANGTAAATNGQHQAYFPGDIYSGQIEVVTPDGLRLESRPLGLDYFDGTNSVLIAELTNSIGVVMGDNQVIYPNAFTDFAADLRYTYTRGGFEQDIILRQQPPTPESLGLNPATARLQILTEFFNPPAPTIQATTLPPQAGLSLSDQSLGFGAMQMVPGRAFLTGTNATDNGVRVAKSWLLLDGRQFLVEEVPVDAILAGLAALPPTALNAGQRPLLAARHLTLPPQRLAKNDPSSTVMLATAASPAQGFVLDYMTVNSSLTNFTFQGDMTYYISGTANLYGTNTLEGGTVIKYANSSEQICISYNATTTLNCLTAPYRPAVFTSMDDNSVGETISGSSGTPNSYEGYGLSFSGTSPAMLHDLRMSHIIIGITFGNGSGNIIRDAQFVQCGQVMELSGSDCKIFNTLFSQAQYVFDGSSTIWCQNATFDNMPAFFYHSPVSLYLTNCLVTAVSNTNGVTGGANNQFFGNGSGIYQAMGGGNYYLATNCPAGVRGGGTTNIDPILLADLRTKTTYAPSFYANPIVSNITFSPQTIHDTNTLPDIGYHYSPLDYVMSCIVSNATLTLTNGVAVDLSGVELKNHGQVVSTGTASQKNYIVYYLLAQEQSYAWTLPYGSSGLVNVAFGSFTLASLNFQFTTLVANPGNSTFLNAMWCTNVTILDCELYGSDGYVNLFTSTLCNVKNNLFQYVGIYKSLGSGQSNCIYNNLFRQYGNSLSLETNDIMRNNVFDGVTPTFSGGIADHNAYLNGATDPSAGTGDIVTNITWVAGPLGNFYQPSNSPLINAGNTTADQLGLYHFTTQTNEVPETNSIVDIGYHYVATDAYGNPLDSNGDGIPDYLEDANGNGLVDGGEIGWNTSASQGFRVFLARPRNGTILP
jgi:archaellum component FlaF (FlaF/FlaG flagellin family)